MTPVPRSQLYLTLFFVFSMTGCSLTPPERLLQRLETKFPPDEHVFNLAGLGWTRGIGQIEALNELIAQNKPDRVIVDVGGTWCAPCVGSYPKFVKAAQEDSYADAMFVFLAVEEDSADYDGIMAYVKNQWNSG